jgi:hypothetical protein
MKTINESKLNDFLNYLNDNLSLNLNNGAELEIKISWIKRYSDLISKLLSTMYKPYIEVYQNCLNYNG